MDLDEIELSDRIQSIEQRATETEADQARRLQRQAEETGVSPETLLEIEDQISHGVRRCVESTEAAEGVAEINEGVSQLTGAVNAMADMGLPEMFGIDPESVKTATALADSLGQDDASRLFAQLFISDPEETAELVATLNHIMESSGLYQELGTEPLAPGELRATVPVEGEEVSDAN